MTAGRSGPRIISPKVPIVALRVTCVVAATRIAPIRMRAGYYLCPSRRGARKMCIGIIDDAADAGGDDHIGIGFQYPGELGSRILGN
jgi:hypothetical protein